MFNQITLNEKATMDSTGNIDNHETIGANHSPTLEGCGGPIVLHNNEGNAILCRAFFGPVLLRGYPIRGYPKFRNCI